MDNYTMVSCDFHDEVEALATLREDCQIKYRNESDQVTEVTSQIVDVYAANHADYIKLKDGTEIRMDRILAVNDKSVSYTCES